MHREIKNFFSKNAKEKRKKKHEIGKQKIKKERDFARNTEKSEEEEEEEKEEEEEEEEERGE